MFAANLLGGRRILVTGGGTGLGKAMAAKFLQLGAEVHICGRRKTVCDETAAELMKAHGGKIVSHGIDIRDAAGVDHMIEEIFVDGPLTDLINNAAGNFISRTEDLSPRGFDAIANIVMHGTFYVTHAVGKRWISDGSRGDVVSVVTTWVRNGGPFVVPSAMSKAAVHVMTMSLAAEWGRYGIRLNAIAPGEIPTQGMSKRLYPGERPGERTKLVNPLGRVGTMEELENLATFLISGGCDWINGETIALDGGQALATASRFMSCATGMMPTGSTPVRRSRHRIRKIERNASERATVRASLNCTRSEVSDDASLKLGGHGLEFKPKSGCELAIGHPL